MNKQKQRIVYQLRWQPYADSDEGILFNYLLNHPVYDQKEAALKAFKPFWKALAYQNTGAASPEKVRQLGWDCINALLSQVEHICACLELEQQQLGALLIAKGCAFYAECSPYFLGFKSQTENAISSGFALPIQTKPVSENEPEEVPTQFFESRSQVQSTEFNLANFDPAMLGPTFS